VADTLSEHAKALLARPVIATLTTVAPSGAPQSTPLWVDLHGDDITINTAQGRAKARNMARDPRVSLCVIDPYDPYNVLALSGTVVDITTKGADEHIDALAKKYLGADSYPARREGEVRIRVRIRPERIAMQPR
jgi:PPOX class probable F420-dependent enzyme